MGNIGIIDFAVPTTGGFIVELILWLVGIVGVVGAIVLFTLMLKLITLPFDFFSRRSMRRNSLKMEEMRPELEKLQKQYVDNKELYQQKMMALYKKNGYSMFGACLPTILTLVIFIIALNGFSDYSRYQNKLYFYNMSNAYNSVVYDGLETDDNFISKNEKGEIVINQSILNETAGEIDAVVGGQPAHKISLTQVQENYVDAVGTKVTISTTNGYVIYNATYFDYNDESKADGWGPVSYTVKEGAVEASNLKVTYQGEQKSFVDYKVIYDAAHVDTENPANSKVLTEADFIKEIQQEKAANKFREENVSFLWVKNIWAPDSPAKHPVELDWNTFKTTHAYQGNDIGTGDYNNLIAKLDVEKTTANGYFILVVLTAAVSFIMQAVTAKTQKAQMELQTVNGQGAQTQKMMKWLMPIMMAIFAFMYTAAFSIYIVLSSVISLGTTFLITAIVDKTYKKDKENQTDGKIRGRVFVPKEEVKPEKKETKKKDDKFAHEKGGDFLTGKADKKHVRGRVK